MRAEASRKLQLASVSTLLPGKPEPGGVSEVSTPPVNIRLLGAFGLSIGERRVDISSRLAAILAYTARRAGTEISRDRLAGLYWGELSTEQARRNVRVALFRINQLLRSVCPGLPPQFIRSLGSLVTIPRYSFVHIDANDFETTFDDYSRHKLHTAEMITRLRLGVDLYREDLLPDLDETWIAEDRENLRAKYLTALKFLLLAALTENDLNSALYWANRSLKADIGDEATAAMAMKIAARIGKRAMAVKIYRALVLVLRREFGISPSPDIIALFQGLTSSPASPGCAEINIDALERDLFGYARR
jgi:DNA-binding SARP family transcriptional activator